VSELLLCALPYHSTPEFARLVALLSLDGTPWAWLGPCQASGAPPPRELLVARCTSDHALLREIARGAQACAEAGLVCRAYLSFYGVLLCEVLCTAPAVSEELLTTLLPFLAKGLAAGAARDYRAATLMALSQLLARAQLSKDFLSGACARACAPLDRQ
jgi:U3 small nucleolar RNA-associated protein 10